MTKCCGKGKLADNSEMKAQQWILPLVVGHHLLCDSDLKNDLAGGFSP